MPSAWIELQPLRPSDVHQHSTEALLLADGETRRVQVWRGRAPYSGILVCIPGKVLRAGSAAEPETWRDLYVLPGEPREGAP